MSQPRAAPRWTRLDAAAGACFFASGTAALLYEVVWVRELGLLFGHTVHAVTTVLAAYMAGLALGSALAGRWADRLARPLRAYGLLEGAVGLLCLATPLLFRVAQALDGWVQDAWSPGAVASGAIRFSLAALVLLPPTTLLGATLPVLSRAVVRSDGAAAARVGVLYALNTWGAVAGTLATGFLLLPGIGLRSTLLVGVALNAAVAAVALWLSSLPRAAGEGRGGRTDGEDRGGGPLEPTEPPLPPARAAIALAAIAASGAASMAYEVAWTRALALVLGSSTYAFTAMLATFLAGLALGAVIAARLLRSRAPGLAAFGATELAVALAAAAVLPAFGLLPDALLHLLRRWGVTHQAALAAQFGLGFLVMIGPTVLVGATFPLGVAALRPTLAAVGRDVGRVYAASTAGTIAGSVAAGFFLLPALGAEMTAAVAGAVNVFAGLAALLAAPARGRRSSLVWAATGAAVVAFAGLSVLGPRWDRHAMTAGVPVYAADMVKDPEGARAARQRRELLLYREGLSTTVAVVRTATATSLSVNGKTDASNGKDMATQLLLGHLGALLHPEPRRALVIGLASGVTAGAVAQHPVEAIDVAEIEPAMVEASAFFRTENRDVLADPRVRVVEGDGRRILARAREPYDLIVSEPSNPWIAGIASLFTREFYALARARLAPGGVMVQWLQTYGIFADDMRMVMRTFAEAFPHVTVWAGARGDVLLVATPGPACLDLGLVEGRAARAPALRQDLERLGLSGERLAFRLVLDDAAARAYSAGAELNTDDLPLLEFSAPRGLYASSAVENEARLRAFRRTDRPCAAGADPVRLTGAEARLEAARMHWAEGKPEDADLELVRMGPSSGLTPAARAARLRLLFTLGQLERAWAELNELSGTKELGAVADHARALLALADPVVAPKLRSALERLPGGWYADPAPYGELLLNVALERGDEGLLPLALEQLRVAARLQPGKSSVANNMGVALAKSGRAEEAAAAFGRAIVLDPADARPHVNLGLLEERRGAVAAAVRHYSEAARIQPALPGVLERIARLQPAADPLTPNPLPR